MSADTTPISPSAFAVALKDLHPSSLRLKLLETRNSMAHLLYSNDQLRPFADGSVSIMGAPSDAPPDQDCIDAMRENNVVIDRMLERVALLRIEFELRGLEWTDIDAYERVAKTADAGADRDAGSDRDARADRDIGANGDAAEHHQRPHPAWSDGTFQRGSIPIRHLRFSDDVRVSDDVEGSDSQASQTEERPGDQSASPNGTHDAQGGDGIHL
ncbi:secondary alcohol dehydrogenase protein [Ophiocordyceps camponoti-floridani]|uniref:Secondary alcohol dehydrogenase protein n=1 Tax=Ophiocordyceps camponoti-floridani TaxID=2030778 RepID=A0A8H4VG39_9HYPO|nr:secondary alcohol dehydrogenase protein [Ophiocordyceps camponoti-floridani]